MKMLRNEDNDWVNICMEYEVEGSRPRGRPKLGERLCNKTVKHADRMGREVAMDRSRWREMMDS